MVCSDSGADLCRLRRTGAPGGRGGRSSPSRAFRSIPPIASAPWTETHAWRAFLSIASLASRTWIEMHAIRVAALHAPWRRYSRSGRKPSLSHRSASGLYELLPSPPGPIHVTTTTRARSRPGIAVHTTSHLPQSAVRTRHGMRVTAPERTLRDLPPHLRDKATEQAHVLGLITDRDDQTALTRSAAERRMLAPDPRSRPPAPARQRPSRPLRGRPSLAGPPARRRDRRIRVAPRRKP